MTGHLLIGAATVSGWGLYAAAMLDQLRRAARRREANEPAHLDDATS